MKITEYLIFNGYAEESEREVLDFGFQMLHTVFISGIIVLLAGIYMGMTFETLVFMMAALPLRQYTGGLHLKTRVGCGIVSVILFVFTLFLVKYAKISLWGQIAIFIAGYLIIKKYAPVDNENNPLDKDMKDMMGRRACIILRMESIFFIFFFVLGMQNFSFTIAWTFFLIGILAVLGVFKKKITEKHRHGENNLQSRNM